jgi:hypothetical protein
MLKSDRPENEFSDFLKRTVFGGAALITTLIPSANIILRVIPVPYKYDRLFGACASLTAFFVFVLVYVARWDLFFWHFVPHHVEQRLQRVEQELREVAETGQFDKASRLKRLYDDLMLSRSARLGNRGYFLAIATFISGVGLLYASLLLQASFPQDLWTFIPYSAAFGFITLAFTLPAVLEHTRKRSFRVDS